MAQECNGFGLLGGALMLTLMLSIYRRVGVLNAIMLLAGSVVMAFIANILRIVIIVLLAPHVPSYTVMHEAVGITVFYGALGLLFWLVIGFGRDPIKDRPPPLDDEPPGEPDRQQA